MSSASFFCVDTWRQSSAFFSKGLGFLFAVVLWRCVVELPTLQFDIELYCMRENSTRSRRVSPVELRAAFMREKLRSRTDFQPFNGGQATKYAVKRRGEGFPLMTPVFGLLAYPRGHYFCQELWDSLSLAMRSRDCRVSQHIVLVLELC